MYVLRIWIQISSGPLLTYYKLKMLDLGVSMVHLGQGLLCKNVCSSGLAFFSLRHTSWIGETWEYRGSTSHGVVPSQQEKRVGSSHSPKRPLLPFNISKNWFLLAGDT